MDASREQLLRARCAGWDCSYDLFVLHQEKLGEPAILASQQADPVATSTDAVLGRWD